MLDYAGGGPVEIASGVTGLAYSLYLGKRRGFGTERLAFKPHNVSHIFIGTLLLWVGWLGFNGGSTFAANLKAALAIVNTNLAGSVAGLVWMFMDYRLERKWSAVGFCTGAIVGLVAITPAAGFVGAPAAVFIGIVASILSNILTTFKNLVNFDDAMDVSALLFPSCADGADLRLPRCRRNRRPCVYGCLCAGVGDRKRRLHRHPRWMARPELPPGRDPARVHLRRVGLRLCRELPAHVPHRPRSRTCTLRRATPADDCRAATSAFQRRARSSAPTRRSAASGRTTGRTWARSTRCARRPTSWPRRRRRRGA